MSKIRDLLSRDGDDDHEREAERQFLPIAQQMRNRYRPVIVAPIGKPVR
jgi:hypothetical protein